MKNACTHAVFASKHLHVEIECCLPSLSSYWLSMTYSGQLVPFQSLKRPGRSQNLWRYSIFHMLTEGVGSLSIHPVGKIAIDLPGSTLAAEFQYPR
ncbi:hypothetical protein BaRGS_00007546 [Batillaria attramentaria]|uniref:Uncharacterized protein n=1 Tax=Batillaria attramentaria TaxID=370345 RepID=A0ABD0LPG9_9CAEN